MVRSPGMGVRRGVPGAAGRDHHAGAEASRPRVHSSMWCTTFFTPATLAPASCAASGGFRMLVLRAMAAA